LYRLLIERARRYDFIQFAQNVMQNAVQAGCFVVVERQERRLDDAQHFMSLAARLNEQGLNLASVELMCGD